MNSLPHTTTARLPLRFTLLSAALLAATSPLLAQDEPEAAANPHTITVKDFLGRDRIINDFDGDGWDDLWCAIYLDLAHRNKTTDTDGDGLTDYEEMVMWRDPFVEGPLPRDPAPEEIEEGKRAAAAARAAAEAAWQRKLEEAAPRMRELLPPGQLESEKKRLQNEADRAALRQAADAARAARPARERTLDDIARRHGVPRIIDRGNGKAFRLGGEFGGVPLFTGSHDSVSAAGISADELWPFQDNPALPGYWPFSDSNTGLNLTGAGQTLGVWENDGGVLTNHIEFGSRVTRKDSASLDTSGHATNVTGTMAAAGVGTLFSNFYESRGVAFGSDVFAYDIDDLVSERLAAAAGGGGDPPLRLANNSWGLVNGWSFEEIDTGNGVSEEWVWYGPSAASQQEDFKFGFYFPDRTEGFGGTQIDTFMHSEATRQLVVYSCGNDRAEGPGSSPSTYYYPDGTSVNAATFPRDWDDGDAGGYDTVASPGTAKNVLTVGACEDVFFTDGGTFLGFGPGANAEPADFSGAGPTDDGRLKPDLVAVGTTNFPIRDAFELTATIGGRETAVLTAPNSAATNNYTLLAIGTSFAAPAVTGALGLVLERREELFPGLPASEAWHGSTLKAIAINSCDDVDAEGPDYRMGHGIMNAVWAVRSVEADHDLGRGSLIKEFSLDSTQTVSWIVESDGESLLAATLAWSDPEGPALTSITGPDAQDPMLVNNLDLKIEYLGADTVTIPPPSTPVATYLPWVLAPDLTNESATVRAQAATRGVDNRNNVEKVSVTTPAAGRYRVTVTHSGGLSGNLAPSTQMASVVLEGVTPALPTIASLAVSPTANEFLLNFTADPGAWFTIETSLDMQSWSDVGSVLAESDVNSVTVTTGGGDPRRFWRLRRGQ